jgi:hypothetical protein
MLKVDEHLIVMEKRGRLYLLKPDASGHHPLSSVAAFDRKTWNHPVPVGHCLYIGNDQETVCLQLTLRDSDKQVTESHQ